MYKCSQGRLGAARAAHYGRKRVRRNPIYPFLSELPPFLWAATVCPHLLYAANRRCRRTPVCRCRPARQQQRTDPLEMHDWGLDGWACARRARRDARIEKGLARSHQPKFRCAQGDLFSVKGHKWADQTQRRDIRTPICERVPDQELIRDRLTASDV